MCGIAAVMGTDRGAVERAVAALGRAQAHRGPDGEGSHVLEVGGGLWLGFAHRRLAIIDLSEGGRQPMADERGNVVVFNGEIYNYRELRRDLEARGEVFRSDSDTEVLLRGHAVLGEAVLLDRLRGMFAYVLWDQSRRRLVAARDPLGIKPLYYGTAGGLVHFASEVRALRAAGLCEGEIDPQALEGFLSFGSVPAPLAIYRGLSALPPGSRLSWEPAAGPSAPVRYWSPRPATRPMPLAEAMDQALRRHLVADVPVATFLSGGYDSTALACAAAPHSPEPLRTYTVHFPDRPELSEREAAAAVARRLGVRHAEVAVPASEMAARLPAFLAAMDQPTDDGFNTFLVSGAVAADGIKACLHGIGGDELFGGYHSFIDVPRGRRLALLPKALRRQLAVLADGDSPGRSKLAEALRSDLSAASLYRIRRRLFSPAQRALLTGRPAGPGLPHERLTHADRLAGEARDLFGAVSALELDQYAADKLLVDGDVFSMAHGLELRLPLLDRDLVEAALALPEAAKRPRPGGPAKPALAAAVPGFPLDLMQPGKRGFVLPQAAWLAGPLRAEAEERLLGGGLDGVLDRREVGAAWTRFLATGGSEWTRAWALFVLACWDELRSA